MRVQGNEHIKWWREYPLGYYQNALLGPNQLVVVTENEQERKMAVVIDNETGDILWRIFLQDTFGSEFDYLSNPIVIDQQDNVWIESRKYDQARKRELLKVNKDGYPECTYSLSFPGVANDLNLFSEMRVFGPYIIYQVVVDEPSNNVDSMQIHIIDNQCQAQEIYYISDDYLGSVVECSYSEEEGLVAIYTAGLEIFLAKATAGQATLKIFYLGDVGYNYDVKYFADTELIVLLSDSLWTNSCFLSWYDLSSELIGSEEIKECVEPFFLNHPQKREVVFSALSDRDEYPVWLLYQVSFDNENVFKRRMYSEFSKYSSLYLDSTEMGQIKVAGLYNYNFGNRSWMRMKTFHDVEAEGVESLLTFNYFFDIDSFQTQGEEDEYIIGTLLEVESNADEEHDSREKGCGC